MDEAAWQFIFNMLLLLTAAFVLGALVERVRLNAILGYLLAGTLLGPNSLGVLRDSAAVEAISELGVALLLFSIGLEFSWKELKSLGAIALGGGTVQIVVTGGAVVAVGMAAGLNAGPSVALGTMIAMSSTAFVLRLLVNRAEIDSLHGRSALGILLLQDIAVVPMVLLVSILSGVSGGVEVVWALVKSAMLGTLLVAGFYLMFVFVVPWLLRRDRAARNRELTVLLAIITAVGAAWAAHALELSPALGAFLAGILLASSPFATQIRADVSSFRTLFVTLFFSSVGMLAQPVWALENWDRLLLIVAAIVLGKTLITTAVVALFGLSLRHAIATGICLAQIGEFSIVLARIANLGAAPVLDRETFLLIVSASIGTFFLTPALVALAPKVADRLSRRARRGAEPPAGAALSHRDFLADHVVIVGFGPAGQRVAESLMRDFEQRVVVVELNFKNAQAAASYGLRYVIGDAGQEEVLHSAHVETARVVAITVPDPRAIRQMIAAVKALAPNPTIVVRSRYHVLRWEFTFAGAHVVIDEEDQVGRRIAAEVRRVLHEEEGEGTPPADGMPAAGST